MQAASRQIYRQNRKHLHQTIAEPNQAVEDSAEDELVIPFTKHQQRHGNAQPEESPYNRCACVHVQHSILVTRTFVLPFNVSPSIIDMCLLYL